MNAFNVELNLPKTEIVKTEKDRFGDILITVKTTEDHVLCRFCKKKIYKRHGVDRERKLKHLSKHSLFDNPHYQDKEQLHQKNQEKQKHKMNLQASRYLNED